MIQWTQYERVRIKNSTDARNTDGLGHQESLDTLGDECGFKELCLHMNVKADPRNSEDITNMTFTLRFK